MKKRVILLFVLREYIVQTLELRVSAKIKNSLKKVKGWLYPLGETLRRKPTNETPKSSMLKYKERF